jgi:CDP-diacylglycerol--glycerol-3-phosphate 3-phosphatidyltransferase
VPNILTLFRIALVPVLVYLLREPGQLTGAVAAFLFFLAALTDYFDGYLARKHGIVTTLGKFLDPLADKLVVVSALIMLAAMPCPTRCFPFSATSSHGRAPCSLAPEPHARCSHPAARV